MKFSKFLSVAAVVVAACVFSFAQDAVATQPAQYSSSLINALNAPDPSPSGGGQYQTGYHRSHESHGWADHLAFEAGAGFTTPIANASKSVNTAWNVRTGIGWNFIPSLGVMAEYQFNRFGLQDSLINQAGTDDGNTHLWSLTLEPTFRYKISHHMGGYLVGGGGFYRALTSFTNNTTGIYCDPFYGCYPVGQSYVVNHFSSNQGGWNAGGGFTFKPNPDARWAYYADVRFTSINTPGATTELIPVNFGVRW